MKELVASSSGIGAFLSICLFFLPCKNWHYWIIGYAIAVTLVIGCAYYLEKYHK